MTIAAIPGETLARRLQEAAPDVVTEWDESSVWIRPEAIGSVASFLHDDPDLDFAFLNASQRDRLRGAFRTGISPDVAGQGTYRRGAEPGIRAGGADGVASVVGVWKGADFQEREIWDLMGIKFTGHPNMKRIMLWEGFDGHPLRKDFL